MTDPPQPSSPDLSGEFPANPYVTAQRVDPTRRLAVAAAVAAGAWAALEVVEATLAYAAQDTYLEAASRGEKAYDTWTPYDIFGLTWIIVAAAAYVITCLWLYQVRTNLEVLSPGAEHARRKGWVWAGWLVPLVSLWFPFQIVRDVLKGLPGPLPTTLIGGWWTLWLFTLVTSQMGPGLTGYDDIDTDAVQRLGDIEGTNAASTIAAALLWLAIIRRITKAQDRALASAG